MMNEEMTMKNTLGEFVWYDLGTTDSDGAIKFYGEVLGFKADSFGKDNGYKLWMIGEEGIGGVMEMEGEGVPPHWASHIGTPDVDATTAKAVELGAKVLNPPTDIPDVGRFSVLADPQGAVFMTFASDDHGPEDWKQPRDQEGSVVWHELMAGDIDEAFSFYSELFDWREVERWEEGGQTYLMYGQGEETYGGIGLKPAEVEAPPYWVIYFNVADIEAGIERVTSNGGKIAFGPMEVPGGSQIVQCFDPQGALFALHQAPAKS
jgi:predicted enzyme related to lactoylglutathione lyase